MTTEEGRLPGVLAALVDGRPAAKLNILDRGLHYGDGVFETLAVRAGEPQLWEWHWERLARGCARLHLAGPDPETVRREAYGLVRDVSRAVLKILVTRGPGGRGYRPGRTAATMRTLLVYRAPDFPPAHWRDGVAVRRCATPVAINPVLAGIKHLNRLEQVLARSEWDDDGIAEGLMLDTTGRVICGTASNVFAVRGAALVTPDLADCGVEGVMRRAVIDAAATLGLTVTQASLRLDDLLRADEVFLTNSLFGIWPVRSIDGAALRTGPVARRLAQRLAAHTLAGATVP